MVLSDDLGNNNRQRAISRGRYVAAGCREASTLAEMFLQVAASRQPWRKRSCKLQGAVSPGEIVAANCREPFAFPVVDAIPVVDTIPVVDAIPVAHATG